MWGAGVTRTFLIKGNAGSSLSRFTGVYLVFEVLQTRVAHFCFCLVRIKMPLLIHRSMPCQEPSKPDFSWEQNKPINRKHINIFLTALVGQSSQGRTGQSSDFTVEFNRERPVCPRDGSHFLPKRGPICPRDGCCLSRRPSRRKCLCLLVFFLARFRGLVLLNCT